MLKITYEKTPISLRNFKNNTVTNRNIRNEKLNFDKIFFTIWKNTGMILDKSMFIRFILDVNTL